MLKLPNLFILSQSLKSNANKIQVCKFHKSLKTNEAEKSTAKAETNTPPNIEINPKYENRNPRNLEWSGHQYKRFGWNLQFPPKDYYHQLSFRVTDKKLESIVKHASGRKLVHLTTNDIVLRQYLHSSRDLCAAMNLARAVADRCLQFGIDQVKYFKDPSTIDSNKEVMFRETLEKSGIKLEEPEFVDKNDIGLDYDNVDFHQVKRDVPFPPKMNKFIREKLLEKVNKKETNNNNN